jgi:hypothetical protein
MTIGRTAEGVNTSLMVVGREEDGFLRYPERISLTPRFNGVFVRRDDSRNRFNVFLNGAENLESNNSLSASTCLPTSIINRRAVIIIRRRIIITRWRGVVGWIRRGWLVHIKVDAVRDPVFPAEISACAINAGLNELIGVYWKGLNDINVRSEIVKGPVLVAEDF